MARTTTRRIRFNRFVRTLRYQPWSISFVWGPVIGCLVYIAYQTSDNTYSYGSPILNLMTTAIFSIGFLRAALYYMFSPDDVTLKWAARVTCSSSIMIGCLGCTLVAASDNWYRGLMFAVVSTLLSAVFFGTFSLLILVGTTLYRHHFLKKA